MINDSDDDEYTIMYKRYMSGLSSKQYIFQMSKCCGYSEWVTLFKKQTLNDLYNQISFALDRQTPTKLYSVIINVDCKLTLKLEFPRSDKLIQDFIRQHSQFFTPVYKLPHKVVYKIYYELDGCRCIENMCSPCNSSITSTCHHT